MPSRDTRAWAILMADNEWPRRFIVTTTSHEPIPGWILHYLHMAERHGIIKLEKVVEDERSRKGAMIESSIGRRDPESGEMKVIAKSCRSDPRYLETLAKLIASNPKT